MPPSDYTVRTREDRVRRRAESVRAYQEIHQGAKEDVLWYKKEESLGRVAVTRAETFGWAIIEGWATLRLIWAYNAVSKEPEDFLGGDIRKIAQKIIAKYPE